MKKLQANIEYLIASLGADSDQARIRVRAHQVRDRYRKVIESVYPQSSQLFLEHTNNVYIMNKDGEKTLIVYVDDSIYAAELNAQRELVKLRLLELFGEQIERFDIYVSRAQYKNHHPYLDEEDEGAPAPPPLEKLSEPDERMIADTACTVEDESLRKSFEKAMTADIARKRTKNGERS